MPLSHSVTRPPVHFEYFTEFYLHLWLCLKFFEAIDYTRRIYLRTIVHTPQISTTISQIYNSTEIILAVATRTLSQSELNLCAYDIEILTVNWAFTEFHEVIQGVQVTILVDDVAVQTLF